MARYVEIDETSCLGCVHCMLACPTKAIRVREGRVARIVGVCIDCGECIRVCPKGAIKPIVSTSGDGSLSRYSILSVSPVLYGQFGEGVLPNEILLALSKLSNYIYDEGHAYEIFNLAMELYINQRRNEDNTTWPLISPCCPVIVRLIGNRFPSLLKHIPPIMTPPEIAAKEIRERLHSADLGHSNDIGIYHVTPCSAEMISIGDAPGLNPSYLDGIVGFNDVCQVVESGLKNIVPYQMLHRSGGVAIGWGEAGGEIAGMEPGRYLAVSGIQECMRYLNKIEMGLLGGMEYMELRACSGGCVGGALSILDRYQARYILRRVMRMFGTEKRVRKRSVLQAYESGWFFREINRHAVDRSKALPVSEAIMRMARIEGLFEKLPEKDCGVCGSPGCWTFAEDVVDGINAVDTCPFLMSAAR